MGSETAYFVYGATLCAALVGVIAFYYSRRRKDRVEHAKYKMLEDDDAQSASRNPGTSRGERG